VRSLQPNLDRNCNDSISNESLAYLLSSGRLQTAAGAALCFCRISEINAGLISQKGVLHHRLSKAEQLGCAPRSGAKSMFPPLATTLVSRAVPFRRGIMRKRSIFSFQDAGPRFPPRIGCGTLVTAFTNLQTGGHGS
jgi:hypothetical protein